MAAIIQRFLEMVGRRPVGAETQDEVNVEFLTQMSTPRDDAILATIFGRIPILTAAKRATFSAQPFAQGSFGALYGSTVNDDRCFKKAGIRDVFELFDTIKEAFIQYFLSQDEVQGNTVPIIFGIYREGELGIDPITITIEMQRVDDTVINYIVNRAAPLTLADFGRIVNGIFTPLSYFNTTYGYVHRDLKANNIMLQRTGPGDLLVHSNFKIIDFGFSCITVTLNGEMYIIKTASFYEEATPCREQQDVLLFLYFFKDQFKGAAAALLSPDVFAFINGFIPAGILADRLPAKIAAAPAANPAIWSAYNVNNALIGPLPDKAAFSIDRLLSAFQVGGRRSPARRRRRITVRNRNGRRSRRTRFSKSH